MQFWLMKSEPGEYSLSDLKNSPDGIDWWDGVRNYQARNYMRDDMQVGDLVLFYHSGKKPSVVGIARIVRAGYPDDTAWNPDEKHYDPKSSPENPIWYRVDIQFERAFAKPIPLTELRQVRELQGMQLLRKGNRLSVMPVTREQFNYIQALANSSS